jgi:hypothetical protein
MPSLATIAALAFTSHMSPSGVISGCNPLTLDDVSQFRPPMFETFQTESNAVSKKPAPVDLATDRRARQYRTELRAQALAGPNFDGHYTVAGWGCGSSCLQFAIVNTDTGAVYFSSDLKTISGVHVGSGRNESESRFWGLRFKLNSRLLIVIGAPNEDESAEGVYYFEWTGKSLRLLQWFKSDKTWCKPDG